MTPHELLELTLQASIASVYSPQYFDGNCSNFHCLLLRIHHPILFRAYTRSFSSDYISISNKHQLETQYCLPSSVSSECYYSSFIYGVCVMIVTFLHACETQPSSCPVQRWRLKRWLKFHLRYCFLFFTFLVLATCMPLSHSKRCIFSSKSAVEILAKPWLVFSLATRLLY